MGTVSGMPKARLSDHSGNCFSAVLSPFLSRNEFEEIGKAVVIWPGYPSNLEIIDEEEDEEW
mgnify:CR=1 FL=1